MFLDIIYFRTLCLHKLYKVGLFCIHMHTSRRTFFVLPLVPQITTKRLNISYKYLDDSLGLFFVTSYNLNESISINLLSAS